MYARNVVRVSEGELERQGGREGEETSHIPKIPSNIVKRYTLSVCYTMY